MTTAGQKYMTELSTRSINAAAPSSSETCPLCGGNDLIRGVRYAKYSDTKDDAVRCQACDCNFPLKAWNARHVAQQPMDLHGAASFVDELIGEDCDDSVRALVRKTILSAAQGWQCHAKLRPEVSDCMWPDCGCEPRSTEIIAALVKQGWTPPLPSTPRGGET